MKSLVLALALTVAASTSSWDSEWERGGPEAVAPLHDRAVPRYHVHHRRLLFGRRVPHPVLVEQERDLERLHHAGHRRRLDAGYASRRQTRPTPCRSSRKTIGFCSPTIREATSSIICTSRTPAGEEKDLTPGAQAEGAVHATGAPMAPPSSSRPTSATRSSSTSIATTPRPTTARCCSRTRTATSRRRFPATGVAGAREAEHDQRQRPVFVERRQQTDEEAVRAQGGGVIRRGQLRSSTSQ